MTKKHFEAIAETLNANHAPLSLVLDFADMCGEFNALFNREAFVRAATNNLRATVEYDHNVLTSYL